MSAVYLIHRCCCSLFVAVVCSCVLLGGSSCDADSLTVRVGGCVVAARLGAGEGSRSYGACLLDVLFGDGAPDGYLPLILLDWMRPSRMAM